jgi:hypothetical protein
VLAVSRALADVAFPLLNEIKSYPSLALSVIPPSLTVNSSCVTENKNADASSTFPAALQPIMPRLGDDIQAIKAWIFEIADILVVNKADCDGVDAAVAALESNLYFHIPVLS